MDTVRAQDVPDVANDAQAGQGVEDFLTAWAHKSQLAMSLLTLDLRVIWTNTSASFLLTEGHHFQVREGVLVTADHNQLPALRAFLQSATDVRTSWVCRGFVDLPMIICAQLVRGPDQAMALAVSMFPTDPERRYVWTDFGEAFQLTRAEVIVIRRVLDGANADEIAEEQGVSVETIRTHIRRLYGKLNINSREQLFALVAPFRIG